MRYKALAAGGAAAVLTLALAPAFGATSAAPQADPSPPAESNAFDGASENGRYIIASPGNEMSATSLSTSIADAGGTKIKSYPNVGAAVASFSVAEAKALNAKDGIVVSPDGEITIAEDVDAEDTAPITDAVAKSWGLDRIDQRALPVDGNYTVPDGSDGGGVDAWIFDTGIAQTHPEFSGRVGTSYDFVGDNHGPEDCNGHGTHVAGTIASNIFGVAPGTTLHAVRVLNCEGSGSYAGIIDAMNFVAGIATTASVANASLGGPFNQAVNDATASFINTAQMPFAIAAGNNSGPATEHSPGSTPTATTVASSDEVDGQSFFSNFGPPVDVYGPGSNIWSTCYDNPAFMCQKSGTSMATPHVAGYYAAYFTKHPDASSIDALFALLSQGTQGAITNPSPNTPNTLVYVSDLATPPTTPPPTTPPPTTPPPTTPPPTTPPPTSPPPTQPPPPPVKPPLKVKVKAVSRGGKFYIDVDPNKRGNGYWYFQLQKWNGHRWVTLTPAYHTKGKQETRTINKKRGTYRAVVSGGNTRYRTTVSRAVFLRK